MSFFSICPRDKKYLDYNIPTIPLNIVRDGIETSPDFKVNINKLNSGNRDFVRMQHHRLLVPRCRQSEQTFYTC